jgi:hypothetical protein
MMAKTIARAPVRDLVVHDLLRPNSRVEFTDYIGEGMEIPDRNSQDNPVLRYNGVNYPLRKISPESETENRVYRTGSILVEDSEGNRVNLNEAEIRIITDSNGMQRLEWSFPEQLLPAYRKSFWFDYYFEMLPIRLIYRVKPTAETMSGAAMGEGATLFVGEWEGNIPNVTFSPSDSNQYYSDSGNRNQTIEIDKVINLTETLPYSFLSEAFVPPVMVEFGNNGWLFIEEFFTIQIPPTGGLGSIAFAIIGSLVVLAGVLFFTRQYLINNKKFWGEMSK